MKKILVGLGASLTVLAGTVLVIGAILYFIWNTAVVWIVPSFAHMGILTALGVATLFAIINNLAHYWINKVIELRRTKALEALNVVAAMNSELAFIKTVLYEKDILTDIDFIAMEVVATKEDAQ